VVAGVIPTWSSFGDSGFGLRLLFVLMGLGIASLGLEWRRDGDAR
jgi:hypothetical protein